MRRSHRDLLAAIGIAGGSMPVSALVKRHAGGSDVARSSTSRTLRRLSDDGFVQLVSGNGDTLRGGKRDRHFRAKHVSLTALGIAVAHRGNGSQTG